MTLLEAIWLASTCAWGFNLGLLWPAISKAGENLGRRIGERAIRQAQLERELEALFRHGLRCRCFYCVDRHPWKGDI